MHPQYSGQNMPPYAAQGQRGVPYSQPSHTDSYNGYEHNRATPGLVPPAPLPSKSASPMPYLNSDLIVQNGPGAKQQTSDKMPVYNQSFPPQMPSGSMPPSHGPPAMSSVVNNQLSQQVNSMHLSQTPSSQSYQMPPVSTHPQVPPPPQPVDTHSLRQPQQGMPNTSYQPFPHQNVTPNQFPPLPPQALPSFPSNDGQSVPFSTGVSFSVDQGTKYSSSISAPPPAATPPFSSPYYVQSQMGEPAGNVMTNAPHNSGTTSYYPRPDQPPSSVYPPSSSSYNSTANGPAMPPTGSQYLPHQSGMASRYPPMSVPQSTAQNTGIQSQAPQLGAQNAQSHIGAPLQSAPAQSRRLDPDHMPSPIQVIEDDRKLNNKVFVTNTRGQVPPLVTTNFTVNDGGICSPRFIRSTVYNVATTAEILKQTYVPFALVISPFALLYEGEQPPPVAEYTESGPVRCIRCKAYMSPFMQFIDGGRRFQCVFCKATTEVPPEYFAHLDHMGERVDKYQRPELCLGSYEFVATKEYCKANKFPNPPAFIFVIDVSYNSVRNGLVKLLCENIKYILSDLPRESDDKPSRIRVGFITYSNVVHFYNIKGNLAQPQMMVVSDVHEMFMPLLDGFLVDLSESEQVIYSLVQQIPVMFSDTRETETILGPAIQAGLEALKAADCSGKLFVFHTTLPIADAPGKLRNRDDRKLLGTEKEKTVLCPQSTFYNNLGQECVAAGCCVDLFLFPNAYIDIATLGQVCRLTGGQVYKYTYFQADIDGERFLKDLKRDVSKPVAFDAVIRVRTSTGIRPTEFWGNFFMSNTTDIEVAAIDCDKAIGVEIKYDDKLTEDEGAYIQAAILFTSCGGERRLRLHNLALNTSSQMSELYRSCELDTIINVFTKEAIRMITEQTPRQVKDYFVSRSAQILACYRKNCATRSSVGQLILPECMKLLPLYTNCLIKCDAIAGGQDMSTDDRSYLMLALNSMNVESSACYIYPRLIALHDVDVNADDIPSGIRCSIERLNDHGVYLLENGLMMFLWIGLEVSQEFLQDVFAVQAVARIDIDKTQLIELTTPLSKRIRGIISKVQSERQRHMKLVIVRQNDKLEILFRLLLVEDRTAENSVSYVDFLCHLHKEIRNLLS